MGGTCCGHKLPLFFWTCIWIFFQRDDEAYQLDTSIQKLAPCCSWRNNPLVIKHGNWTSHIYIYMEVFSQENHRAFSIVMVIYERDAEGICHYFPLQSHHIFHQTHIKRYEIPLQYITIPSYFIKPILNHLKSHYNPIIFH